MSTQVAFDSPVAHAIKPADSAGIVTAAASGIRQPDVRLSIHRDLSEIESEWRAFEERADCTVFQTFDWLSTWQRNIGSRAGVTPVVVVGRLDGQALFLLPLATEPGGLARKVVWLGSYLCNYNGPILAADFSGRLSPLQFAAVWRDVKALLARNLPVDLIDLEKMPETIGEQANPFLCLGVTPHVNDAYLATLGSDWEKYYAEKRSSASRKTDRKRRKHLAEHGEVRFLTAANAADVQRSVDALIDEKRKAYAKLGVDNMFEWPGYREFFLDMATNERSRTLTHVSRFDVGAVAAAANYGLIFRGRYYYILAGYDDGELGRLGPGTAQLNDLMRYAIERGIKQFDFTIGDEPYKREWSDTDIHLFDHVAPVTLRGRLAAGLLTVVRMAKRPSSAIPRSGRRRASSVPRWVRCGVRRGADPGACFSRSELARRGRRPDQHVHAQAAFDDHEQQDQLDHE